MTTKLAVPLDARVELASKQWVVEVKAFLEPRGIALAGLQAPFTISARYTDPPPHLSADGTSLGISFTFDNARIDVAPSWDPDADFVRTSDYNAEIPFACIVYGADGVEPRRLEREYASLVGAKRGQFVGTLPPEPVQRLMADLHDHMAVRTLNNPDIAHRARHLGLEQNLADLDETGYTVLANAFTDAYADELREETQKNHVGREEGASFRATMLLERGRIWEEAALHPWVLTLAEHLLGRGCLIYQSDTIVKGPGMETHPGLHADYGASRIGEPFPDYCLEATAVWAIDDFMAEHGPTVIQPGSFRKRRQVPPGTTQDDTVMIEMKQGSIAFWHGATWHGSTPRTAPGKRTSLHNAYSRNFLRTIERYEDIDPGIIARNPPAFSTLCGLDDPFGKSGAEGADFDRLGYCARAGYGSSAAPALQK